MKQYVFPHLRFPRAVTPVKRRKWLTALVAVLVLTRTASPVYAGGGGENMLLVVNPNDEPSLRIANAYVQARRIPVNNILYIAPPTTQGYTLVDITAAQFISTYQNAIPAAIAARGLANQIDYIGTIGQPQRVNVPPYILCFHDCLNQLTQLQNAMPLSGVWLRNSELFLPLASNSFPYVHGSNTAIHHATQYPAVGASGTVSYAQWYLSGVIGNAGVKGLTTSQAIQNLQRTVAADGSKPAGTMYFEDSNDAQRTGERHVYWPVVEAYMTENGIPWIEESLSNGYVPTAVNRRDVMGSEIGMAGYLVPNGSIYLPGSWADDMTSYGAVYGFDSPQTLSDTVLLSGAGGSSGTVAEPGNSTRFPQADIKVFSNDGYTLGEAFYSAVPLPDLIQFQGDLLSQAYADIPTVAFTTAPANGATVSGSVALSGSGFLPNLTSNSTATGIGSLALFVDGVNTGAFVTGASGSFNLNTTTLTDGVHEVRLVAYNNSAAASEGYAIRNWLVNNLGQSVSITGSSTYNVAFNQTLSIPVSASQGSGPPITGIQLQSLGRVVGSISGLSGNVTLSGSSLIYGVNTIVPAAVLASGQQVQGLPMTVTRRFQLIAGKAPTPMRNRIPGFDYYFYPGVAQKTIATTNFSGTAAYVSHSNILQLFPYSATPSAWNMPNIYRTASGGNNRGLGVMIKGSFTVTTPGEYTFAFSNSYWTSCNVSIDGVSIGEYDCWNGSTLTTLSGNADTTLSAYLLSGEHTVTVKLANLPTGTGSVGDAYMTVLFWFRGVDANVREGVTHNVGTTPMGPFFYTVGH